MLKNISIEFNKYVMEKKINIECNKYVMQKKLALNVINMSCKKNLH